MDVHIECIEGKSRGRRFPLKSGRTLIGRSSSCDICLDANEELGVSGRHCEIRVIGSQVTIEDCGSTNGTLLAGKRLTDPMVLKNGATFRLGRQGPIFRFVQAEKNPPTAREKMQPGTAPVGVTGDGDSSNSKWVVLFVASLIVVIVTGVLIADAFLKFLPNS